MALTDQRAEEAVARFESKEIIAETMRNHPELVGRFSKLRFVNTKQLELALVHGGDIDNERGPWVSMVEREIQECLWLVWRIGRPGCFHRAMDTGIPNHETRSEMIGVPIFPEWRQNDDRAIAADDIGDEFACIRRIREAAIWQPKVFARNAAEELRGPFRFLSSGNGRTAVAHFASSQVNQCEGNTLCCKRRAMPPAPHSMSSGWAPKSRTSSDMFHVSGRLNLIC